MFGQSSFGGFGQTQAAPAFGSTPSSTGFGASTAFGSTQPSPFGGSTSTGVFGASQPAFGASPAPAFGAPQSQGGLFGGSAFGAKPATPAFSAGFGSSTTTPSPFGAPSQPAFGAPASTPAFGGFGAPASSASAFGAASTPAFGASSSPGFGSFGASSTPAFGAATPGSAFGAPGSAASQPSPFGGSAFGASPGQPQQQNRGSTIQPYAKHQDKDSSSSTATPTTVYYNTITAMPQYVNKSVEELRWEDYQLGVRNANSPLPPGAGAPAAASPPGAFGGSAFGASTGGAFGLGQSAPSPFGASSTPAFGAPASSPSPFGGGAFGAAPASTPAFGFGAAASTPATGTGLFGASTSQPATGAFGAFGGSSTPAFGAASSTPAFGAASTPSLFGGSAFGASTGGGLFGGSSTPAFGAAASAPSPFGASSTPAFGTPGSSPFGTPAASTPAFGAPAATNTFSFGTPGAAASKPATFSFSSTPASGGLFGAPASTGSLFGAASTPAFGATGGSLFGSTPTSAPATGTSLFGGSAFGAAPATGGLFGAPAATGTAPGGSAFGGFGAAPAAPAAPVQPASVSQQPYGALQPLPQVNVPEHKVGITQRPVRAAVTSMRPSPLLTLRTSTPKFGLGTAAGSFNKTGGISGAGASAGSPYSLTGNASPAAAADGNRSGSPAAALLLPVRDNPHRLFIRSPPPSTTPAANGSSFSPAVGRAAGSTPAGAEESTPVRTPATRRTPYQQTAAAETPATNGTAGKAAAAADKGTSASTSKAAAAAERPDRQEAAGGDAPRLGDLESEGYSLEPSLRELQDLARRNPSALSHVSDFKIIRDGYGMLEWQQPVDIRGLDLDHIVQIERGEVSLYINNTAEKPPIGSGLNCQCKVTLEGIYKKSKAGQQPDAAAVAAFRKRLARYCSEMGARFIDYKPEGGVWTFEVDHFSRYGLPADSDDDEDECMPDEDFETPGKATSQEPELTFGGPAFSDDDDDMATAAADGDVTQQQRLRFNDDDMAAADDDDEQQQQQGLDQDQVGLGSVPLQHSLPALLGHEADDLMELRGAFFRKGGVEGSLTAAAAANELAAAAAAGPSASPMMRDQGFGLAGFGQQQQRAAAAAVLPEHSWVRPRPALLQPPQKQHKADRQQQQQQIVLFGGDSDSLQQIQQQRQQQAVSASTGPPIAAPLTSRDLQKRTRMQEPSVAAAAAVEGLLPPAVGIGNSGTVIDASLMLARSFRVGWSPNGILVIPQNPLGSGSSSSKTLAGPAAGFSIGNEGDGKDAHQQQRQQQQGSSRAAAICKAEDLGVPCIEFRRLQPIAAVAGSSSSSDLAALLQGGDRDAAAAEAMQQRVLSSLELHLQCSSSAALAAAAGGDDADMMDHEQQSAAAAGGNASKWCLQVDRKQITDFVQHQIQCIESAAGSSSSSSDAIAQAAGCGQHIKDLWQLLRVLYEYIEGEEDPPGSDTPLLPAAAAALQDGSSLEDGPIPDNSSSRSQLAAMKRKANISRWLQRKLKPAVEDSLRALQNPGSSSGGQQQQQDAPLWSLLHLMTGRQIAAAAAVAAAIGDVRLATLLTAAGQAAAGIGGRNIVTQIKSWARAGMLPSHISKPRRLLLALLAAAAPASTAAGSSTGGVEGLVEVSTALGLDWSRAFGLWLWYGVPFTEPVAAVTTAFTAALAAAQDLPRPVPPHAAAAAILPQQQQQQRALVLYQQQQQGIGRFKQPNAGFAAADTQYALLQLQARGGYGLGVALLDQNPGSSSSGGQGLSVGALISKLLRVSGYSSNPLDYATAWQLLMVLESIGALPQRTQEYESMAINIASSLISQLLLLGPEAIPWTNFVALQIPDHSDLGISCREAALKQLLQLTVQHWTADPATVAVLRDTLQLPVRWLHESQAIWYGYCHDHSLQLLHLLAAAEWQQAHDLACAEIAPLLARSAGAAAALGGAAAAGFAAAAERFLAAAGSSVADAALAAALGDRSSSGGGEDHPWEDVIALQEEPSAAVAAAAYVAAICVVATGTASLNSSSSGRDPDYAVQNPAQVAAVSLRALCRVLNAVSAVLGPPWSLGVGVYTAWCGVFLDAEGHMHDPAAAVAKVAAAAADPASPAAAAAAAAGEAVERCLHLSDLLAAVAAATDSSSGSSSAWWGTPTQRLVQARMTADVGKALIRLGVSSSSSDGKQQQHAPLLVPLAAAGFSSSGVSSGGGLLGGGQSAAQLLAGAAANVAGGLLVM